MRKKIQPLRFLRTGSAHIYYRGPVPPRRYSGAYHHQCTPFRRLYIQQPPMKTDPRFPSDTSRLLYSLWTLSLIINTKVLFPFFLVFIFPSLSLYLAFSQFCSFKRYVCVFSSCLSRVRACWLACVRVGRL